MHLLRHKVQNTQNTQNTSLPFVCYLETFSACFCKLSFAGEEIFIGIFKGELFAWDQIQIHAEDKQNNCVTFWHVWWSF